MIIKSENYPVNWLIYEIRSIYTSNHQTRGAIGNIYQLGAAFCEVNSFAFDEYMYDECR